MRAQLSYLIYRGLGGLAGRLPPAMGYRLAAVMARLMWVVMPDLRHAILHNMGHVLGPDAEPQAVCRVARQACLNIAKGHYELFRLGRLSADQIKAAARFAGREHLDRALADGLGAVLFSAHLGNVDLAMQLPVIHGIPLVGAAYHVKPERLFRYTLKLRQRFGVVLLPSDQPLLGLFRALKRGQAICLPVDRNLSDSAMEMPFFGEPALLPAGAVRIALRTGAPLIPAFVERLPDDTFLVHIEPPVELEQTGDRQADLMSGTVKVVAVLERYVAKHPEQWLVAAPVWLSDPPVEALDPH